AYRRSKRPPDARTTRAREPVFDSFGRTWRVVSISPPLRRSVALEAQAKTAGCDSRTANPREPVVRKQQALGRSNHLRARRAGLGTSTHSDRADRVSLNQYRRLFAFESLG